MRRVSEADSGKGQMLRLKAKSADKGSMVSEVHENASRQGRRRDRESGQALVEFALILPLFILLVVGIIQFGVGLNYWLDMQRIANQGARWGVVEQAAGHDRELRHRRHRRLRESESPAVPRWRAGLGRSQALREHLLPEHHERGRRPREGRARNPVHVRSHSQARHDQAHGRCDDAARTEAGRYGAGLGGTTC